MPSSNDSRVHQFSPEISFNERAFALRAVRAAEKSKHKTPVGATLVVAGRVTSATNRLRNANFVAPYTEQSVHAEVRAVLRAYRNGRGGTIYVARLGARGRLLASYPCQRCLPVLKEAGVKRVVWWSGDRWEASKL